MITFNLFLRIYSLGSVKFLRMLFLSNCTIINKKIEINTIPKLWAGCNISVRVKKLNMMIKYSNFFECDNIKENIRSPTGVTKRCLKLSRY